MTDQQPKLLTTAAVQQLLKQYVTPFHYFYVDEEYFVDVDDDLAYFYWDEGNFQKEDINEVEVAKTKFYLTSKYYIEFKEGGTERTLSLVYDNPETLNLVKFLDNGD
jgi:hypothetical protein